MGEGLQFAALATRVGKKDGARFGQKRVTVTAVGRTDGERWVMAVDKWGMVILGEPGDFTIPEPRKRVKR